MKDIPTKHPGENLFAEEVNEIVAELKRLAKWRVAPPLELHDTDAGFTLGTTGSGDEVKGNIRPCLLKNASGSGGGPSTPCTYIYNGTDTVTGKALGSTTLTMMGSGSRLLVGPTYQAATNGIYYKAGGVYFLVDAYETASEFDCPDPP